MKVGKTNRGFQLIAFKDQYANECSLQQSSLALYREPGTSAIWLGVDNANPQIMASKTPQGGNGWVPYNIPEDVSLTTRMHLNRWMVKRLIPHLQAWVDSGSFKIKKRGNTKGSQQTLAGSPDGSPKPCYTEEQIRKAGIDGEVSMIDVEHVIDILKRTEE